MEQFANFNALTTVASGGYMAGSGVLNVASTTSPFPGVPTYRLVIQDATTNATKVLLKVTGINSGSQFAVTSEGTDANADENDNVYCVNSAGATLQMIADINQTGIYADLPTVPPAGYRYKCTDSEYDFISDGTEWNGFARGTPITPPPATTSFTGEGTISLSTIGGTLQAASSAAQFNAAVLAAPGSVPYTFDIAWNMVFAETGDAGGLCLSDGTKYEFFFVATNGTVAVQYNSALNTFGTTLFTSASIYIQPPTIWLRVVIDSSHKTFYIGDGVSWTELFQESNTANLTVSKIGIMVYGNSSVPTTVRFLSFSA